MGGEFSPGQYQIRHFTVVDRLTTTEPTTTTTSDPTTISTELSSTTTTGTTTTLTTSISATGTTTTASSTTDASSATSTSSTTGSPTNVTSAPTPSTSHITVSTNNTMAAPTPTQNTLPSTTDNSSSALANSIINISVIKTTATSIQLSTSQQPRQTSSSLTMKAITYPGASTVNRSTSIVLNTRMSTGQQPPLLTTKQTLLVATTAGPSVEETKYSGHVLTAASVGIGMAFASLFGLTAVIAMAVLFWKALGKTARSIKPGAVDSEDEEEAEEGEHDVSRRMSNIAWS